MTLRSGQQEHDDTGRHGDRPGEDAAADPLIRDLRSERQGDNQAQAGDRLNHHQGPLLQREGLKDPADYLQPKASQPNGPEGSGRERDAQRTTLFRFAYYLGWREYVRTQVQLLRFENEQDTRQVAAFLNDVTRALASDKPDGQHAMLWSDEQRGIGELMTEQPPGASAIVRGHAAFHRDYDTVFAEWMERFADGLFSLDVARGNRLRLVQWALYGLVQLLNEEGAYGGRWIETSVQEISDTPPLEKVTHHEQELRKHLDALKPSTSSS